MKMEQYIDVGKRNRLSQKGLSLTDCLSQKGLSLTDCLSQKGLSLTNCGKRCSCFSNNT